MEEDSAIPKVYFHVDLDAFFASVEQLDHPEYRGKPLIVGGIPGDRRAVVSTASYEARKFGVHSAMPIVKAAQLCPHGIFVRGNYQRYQEKSLEVMEIFQNYSPEVIQMSIDEAFLDLTGTSGIFGSAEETAKRLKKEVLEKTGLTVSVGIASTMYVAKIASGLKKPDGLTIVQDGKEEEFMMSLPLEKLWGCGTKTQERLKAAGLKTIKEIHGKSENLLISIFGKGTGSFLYTAVRGNRDLIFGGEAKNHSISSERTFDFDLTDRTSIDTALMELCMNVLYRMHKEHVRSKTVALKIRYEDFTTVSVQQTSEFPVSNADDLYERCKTLFAKKWTAGRGIRLLGIACQNVEDKSVPVQRSLFASADEKKAKVEEAIFAMEDKHPELKIRKARLYSKGAK
ncbi:MAG: DNA polymerase IV [Treponema sp.]|nr:DNA polymerase IV [Treponema sp.]